MGEGEESEEEEEGGVGGGVDVGVSSSLGAGTAGFFCAFDSASQLNQQENAFTQVFR